MKLKLRGWVLVVASVVFTLVVWTLWRGGSGDGLPVVAVATLMQHPALDQVDAGMVEELQRQGFVDGTEIRIIRRNANGQVQLAAGIANYLARIIHEELDAGASAVLIGE